MGSSSGSDVEAGFAKLQGEDFEYYMQTYSIILGRNSKKSTVDVDLSSLGGGMNISRHHARIFYDFQRRRFALEVLGKNGCLVEGVLHLPGNPPRAPPPLSGLAPFAASAPAPIPGRISVASGIGGKKGRGGRLLSEYFDDDYDDEEGSGSGKKMRREGHEVFGGKAGLSGQLGL
ncbi:Transcriptional activator FHA1 [Vitis vinifera]|uniref:Transcriptional activator FHA1 n=1 Tax=Vitis vinifera TaxID=29760 RepID=A0A438FUD8_VITVI|nr:Transcriptional activator FHA1 [Vitis vinifera]